MPDRNTLADLLEARLAVRTAERELQRLEPTDPARHAAEALLRRARSRYARAVQTQDRARRTR
jgi:hypothetical protein